jgi:hypothetical protein
MVRVGEGAEFDVLENRGQPSDASRTIRTSLSPTTIRLGAAIAANSSSLMVGSCCSQSA